MCPLPRARAWRRMWTTSARHSADGPGTRQGTGCSSTARGRTTGKTGEQAVVAPSVRGGRRRAGRALPPTRGRREGAGTGSAGVNLGPGRRHSHCVGRRCAGRRRQCAGDQATSHGNWRWKRCTVMKWAGAAAERFSRGQVASEWAALNFKKKKNRRRERRLRRQSESALPWSMSWTS